MLHTTTQYIVYNRFELFTLTISTNIRFTTRYLTAINFRGYHFLRVLILAGTTFSELAKLVKLVSVKYPKSKQSRKLVSANINTRKDSYQNFFIFSKIYIWFYSACKNHHTFIFLPLSSFCHFASFKLLALRLHL